MYMLNLVSTLHIIPDIIIIILLFKFLNMS